MHEKQAERRTWCWRVVACAVLFLWILGTPLHGQAKETEPEEEKSRETDAAYESIFEELGLQELEQKLQAEGIVTPMPVSDMLRKEIDGDTGSILRAFINTLRTLLAGELSQNKNLMLELVGIVLVGSIFVNLSNSFAGGFVSENGFYITYMLMTSMLLTSFTMALSVTIAALDKIMLAVRLLVPAFLLVLQFVGHTQTAGGTYNLVLIAIWVIQAVVVRVVLPLIEFYVVLTLVNNLQKEDSFSKLAELVQSLIRWLLKTVIAVVIGLNVIKGLLGPQMDLLGKTVAQRVINSMPGGAASVLAGTYLACGMVIKNSIGVAGILILSFVCLIPLAQLFLILFTVRLTSALIQPMGDRRYVDGTTALGKGIAMLMQSLASVLVLFLITLAIMTGTTNG